jgi:hypothetical protein
VHDSATLAGATAGAGGTVTYTVYTDSTCATPATNQIPGQPPVVKVINGVVPNSAAISFLRAGSYFWGAAYSGDPDNNGASSTCTSEPIAITKSPTTLGTVVFDAASNARWTGAEVAPAVAFDTATISGQAQGIVATGTVTYTFFMDGACSGPGSPAGAPSLTAAGAVPNSDAEGPLAPGSYSFEATYSGDTHYTSSTSPCEKFIVQEPTSLITHGDASCQEFTSGTAPSLTAGLYSIMGTTINGVNPGVFSYITRVVAPAATFTASITETNDSAVPPSYPNVPVNNSQVIVYNSACQVVTSGVTPTFPSTGDVSLRITGATSGTAYIVSVKYSLTSLKGQPVPPKNPLTYSFSTDVNSTLVSGSQQNLLFENRAT